MTPIKPPDCWNLRLFIFNITLKEFESLMKQYGINGSYCIIKDMSYQTLGDFLHSNDWSDIDMYVHKRGSWVNL